MALLLKESAMKRIVLVVLLILPFAAAAQPAPKSIADCERIKADLAYNQCLASFGPKMGERRSSRVAAPADDETDWTIAISICLTFAGAGWPMFVVRRCVERDRAAARNRPSISVQTRPSGEG